MRSFIFNFNSSRRNRCHGKALVVFMVSFALVVSLGEILARVLPSSVIWRGGFPLLYHHDVIITETDSDQYEIYDCLYYGIGKVIENAHKADVLFLGNSRVLYAFPESIVQAVSKDTNLRFFNLCYPANDGMVMAYETLLRLDLKPSVVVVNANYFFNHGISNYALKTMKEGWWRSNMWLLGRQISWDLRNRFHRYLPRFGFNQTLRAKPSFYDQSAEECFLEAENGSFQEGSFSVREPAKAIKPSAEELGDAKWFLGKMEERGIFVVLVDIPYDPASFWMAQKSGGSFKSLSILPENTKPYYRVDELAKILRVPLIHPNVGALTTMDGSHLTKESAERYSKGFFMQFLTLPAVQTVMKTKPGEKTRTKTPNK